MLLDYEAAQRRAGRRHGFLAGLAPPGEAGIGDLTAAFTALAAGDQARLARLHRRLRRQARRGDTQAAAMATFIDVLLELIAAEALGRLLLLLRALQRVAKRRILHALGRSLARTRSSPPWQDPVLAGHCPNGPPVSAAVSCPEVAA